MRERRSAMGGFTILPAIDLKGGKCVRLRQGVAADATVYGDDPVAQALDWASQGAEWLHVVDLDGAFQGKPAHLAVVGAIAKAVGIPVECGGGLRTDADVEALLAVGVRRRPLTHPLSSFFLCLSQVEGRQKCKSPIQILISFELADL